MMAAKLTFEAFMMAVDRAIAAKVGLTSRDLADWMYWDAWEDGMMPKQAAREALAAEGSE